MGNKPQNERKSANEIGQRGEKEKQINQTARGKGRLKINKKREVNGK